ncbi:CG32038 [Drosophila busckii]|uniref:CG32038 n=1 Tax=Drosophila busckii TaxID=30019 RepID=A0A0M4EGA1_DROBS|nr:uncharacterized protein LOC108598917 [Drosophila busckii]ALC43415.1 CG32038 [Drosophila busckii]
MLDNIINFANYWWFRYLMVTELYVVEKWERVTIHVIFMLLFCVFWYFNYSIMLSMTSNLLGYTPLLANMLPAMSPGQGVKGG